MNLASFNISLSEAGKTLKKFDLFRMKGVKSINSDGVSPEFKKASQGVSYFEAYDTGVGNLDYDYLLSDQSFFQFEIKEVGGFTNIRYSFYQNPISYISYNEFLLNEIIDGSSVFQIEEIGDLYRNEYDQYLNEQELISNHTTIRYDSDLNNHYPLVHSASHIHIGHKNNIRISVNKTITPLMFILFVIKNVYYDEWKKVISKEGSYIEEILTKGLTESKTLHSDHWKDSEELELFLT